MRLPLIILFTATLAQLPVITSADSHVKDYAAFNEQPLSDVAPQGWILRYLRNQRDGLTGHIEAAGYPFDSDGWYGGQLQSLVGEFWGPYEQTAYWVDGSLKCGYLLEDRKMIDRALKQVEYVLDNADPDGYMGPKFLKKPQDFARWPHVVFFRSLMGYYSATGDERIPAALAKHYLSNTAPHNLYRNICNVEIMLWAYDHTGDRRLLDMAVKAYDEFQELNKYDPTNLEHMLSDESPSGHGVTYCEQSKQAAILYSYTGNRRYLDAVANAFKKLDRDHMLVDGIPSSTEVLSGKAPLASHETCDIADYTWSAGYLLMAAGDADYADKIERACFNAAPGAVRSDFKGLQYFSCPNQVVCDRHSNHNEFFKGLTWMSYRPNPATECCPGDVHRIMPNYVSRMWMKGKDDAVVAALYGPSTFKFEAGRGGVPVTIEEKTGYPFEEKIDFKINCGESVNFPFVLRIPGWASGASIQVNGVPYPASTKPGTFVTLKRGFKDGDIVTLNLPMKLKVRDCADNGISVERGPLVYSLKIEEDWHVDGEDKRSTIKFPAWNLYPASPWNYALALNDKPLDEQIEVVKKPLADNPWSIENAPIELKVPAYRVNGWAVEEYSELKAPEGAVWPSVTGRILLTPPLPPKDKLAGMLNKEVETVTLVPYGCAKLRITIFPNAGGV